jgi:hypothetical protein
MMQATNSGSHTMNAAAVVVVVIMVKLFSKSFIFRVQKRNVRGRVQANGCAKRREMRAGGETNVLPVINFFFSHFFYIFCTELFHLHILCGALFSA